MNLNITVNEAGQSAPVTLGTYHVRAFYVGQQDSGHLFGPYGTRQAAEQCALVLSGRANVEKATIEEGV
jgi:hypothetical protein